MKSDMTLASKGERLHRAAMNRARLESGNNLGIEDTEREHRHAHVGPAARPAHTLNAERSGSDKDGDRT